MLKSWVQKLRRWWQPEARSVADREAGLHAWYRTALGRSLEQAEQAVVRDVLNSGYHPFVVQLDVGLHKPLFDAAELKCKSSLIVSHEASYNPCPSVQASLDSLPLLPDSVDSLVIHHALEFAELPHRVLREAAQSVRPGGHLIIVGFNPYGLWSLARLFRWRRAPLPWEGRFMSLSRVADWCELLDCGVVRKDYFYHWPPLPRTRWKSRGRWLNGFVRRFLPVMGGVYVIVVRKNQLELLNNHRWQPAFFLKGRAMSKQREQVVNRWKS